MRAQSWTEAPLSKVHDRLSFDCGVAALNDWLQRFSRQNHESGGAKTFITASAETPNTILGFYCLSPASLDYARTPSIAVRGLARHDVPVFRLGRLAVDKRFQGQGIGGELLVAAARRCMLVAEQVGGVGLVIDSKDEAAAKWYERYGAVRLVDAPLSLVLPFATLRKAGLSV